MRRILPGIGMALGLSFCTLAFAEEPPKSAFSTDEAAHCAAIHAFTLDAMSTATNVPRTVRNRIQDGLAIWEYELAASAPGASKEALQAAADRAVAYVRADLPAGEDAAAAQARGMFLTSSAEKCEKMVRVAYGGAEHPVIPYLRQAEVTVGDPTLPPSPPVKPPTETKVAADAELTRPSEETKARGLR